MAYTPEEIHTWVGQGESETLEFKSRLRDAPILARLISAFGNASGGVILVGVGDNGELLGTDSAEVSRVFHLALAGLVNAPKVDLEATVVDGKQIATITIGKSGGLTVSEAGAFQRVRDRVEPMAADDILGSLQKQGSATEHAQPIAEAIYLLTERIRELEETVRYGNTLKGQIRNYLIGGLVGAVLGFFLTVLFSSRQVAG